MRIRLFAQPVIMRDGDEPTGENPVQELLPSEQLAQKQLDDMHEAEGYIDGVTDTLNTIEDNKQWERITELETRMVSIETKIDTLLTNSSTNTAEQTTEETMETAEQPVQEVHADAAEDALENPTQAETKRSLPKWSIL